MRARHAIAGVLAGSIPAATFLVLTLRWTQPCIGASRWEFCSTLKVITHLGSFAVAGAIAQAVSRTRLPVAAAAAGVSTAYLAAWTASYVYPYGPKGPDTTIVDPLLGVVFLGVLSALSALGGSLFARATRGR